MPRIIIKLENKYLEWSTVVDAPVTYGMSLKEFKEYYKEEYGSNGMEDLPRRLQRVNKTGSSSMTESLGNLIAVNRAGENERRLTKKGIIKKYITDRPKD